MDFHRFITRYETQISYVLALVLGAAIFHFIFDIPTFMQLYWGMDGQNDLALQMTGFFGLRAAPWNFPLLWTDYLSSPQGMNIYYTDSVVLPALLFKLLAPVMSPDFHYFKIWMLMNYLLQPVSAVYLVRKLGLRSIPAAFFASVFSLLLTWLLFRFNHTGMSTQYVLIFSLALYIEQCRIPASASKPRSTAVRWTLLILATFMIHTYLWAMVVGIFAAAVLDGKYDHPTFLGRWLHRLNLFILPVLVLASAYMLLIGPNGSQDSYNAGGYGYFSLNLMGPFYGGN